MGIMLTRKILKKQRNILIFGTIFGTIFEANHFRKLYLQAIVFIDFHFLLLILIALENFFNTEI